MLLYLASLKLSQVGGWGWLENLISMKTQSSVSTWILDFDLGFVKIDKAEIPKKNQKTTNEETAQHEEKFQNPTSKVLNSSV